MNCNSTGKPCKDVFNPEEYPCSCSSCLSWMQQELVRTRRDLAEFTGTDWEQEGRDHAAFLKAEDRESGFVDCSKCGRGYHISGRQGALEGEHTCPRCRQEQETQALKDRIADLEFRLVEAEQRAQEAGQSAESYEKLYAEELYRQGDMQLNFDQKRADDLRRTIGEGNTGGIPLRLGRELLDDRQAMLRALGQAQDDIKDLQAKMSNSRFNAEQGAKARKKLWEGIRSAPCPNGDPGCAYMSNPVCCKQYGREDHNCWKLDVLKAVEEATSAGSANSS